MLAAKAGARKPRPGRGPGPLGSPLNRGKKKGPREEVVRSEAQAQQYEDTNQPPSERGERKKLASCH
jgi:hypothetical protein